MPKDDGERDPQTYGIIGAAFEVHRILGKGFLEVIYQDALEIEFAERGIPYVREAPLTILYKNQTLPHPYRVDFVCYENILVETKALEKLATVEESQIIHYLKASGFRRGLLINFGAESLQPRRFVLD